MIEKQCLVRVHTGYFFPLKMAIRNNVASQSVVEKKKKIDGKQFNNMKASQGEPFICISPLIFRVSFLPKSALMASFLSRLKFKMASSHKAYHLKWSCCCAIAEDTHLKMLVCILKCAVQLHSRIVFDTLVKVHSFDGVHCILLKFRVMLKSLTTV